MKYMIVSDIHGSAYYTRKVVKSFHELNCDKMIVLGDILYHGPRNPLPLEYDPKEVIEQLNEIKIDIIACRGNCDSEVDQMVLEFPITNTSQVIPEDDRSIYISHGHIYSPENLPSNIQANDIFLFGHTHIPTFENIDGITIINPGSISLPKELNPHTFGILEDDTYKWFDVDGQLLNTYKIK